MAWARVTSATKSLSGNPTAGQKDFSPGALGAAVSVGDRILVAIAIYNNDGTSVVSTVTDSLGHNYSKDFSSRIDGSIAEVSFWSVPVTSAGTPTVTGHCSINFVSGGEYGIAVGAYSGLSTATGASAIDVSKTATGTTSPADSGTSAGTTTAANELLAGFYGDDGWNTTMAAGTGFSLFSSTGASIYEQAFIEDKDSGASGSTAQATVASAGSAWFCAAVVYKLAGGGGGITAVELLCSERRSRLEIQVIARCERRTPFATGRSAADGVGPSRPRCTKLEWCPRVATKRHRYAGRHQGTTYAYRRACLRCGQVLARGIYHNVPILSAVPLPAGTVEWTTTPGWIRR
jgi:hypothetical protein